MANGYMTMSWWNAIPKKKQDKEMQDKMYAERDGIVYKAVKALQTINANDNSFSEPACITEAREKYQTEKNTDIITMNVYTHIGFDDAEEKMRRMEEFRKEQAEVEKRTRNRSC